MLKRTVRKKKLHDGDEQTSDFTYWINKPLEDRPIAVENLRKQFYGDYPERLQRVYRIIKRK